MDQALGDQEIHNQRQLPQYVTDQHGRGQWHTLHQLDVIRSTPQASGTRSNWLLYVADYVRHHKGTLFKKKWLFYGQRRHRPVAWHHALVTVMTDTTAQASGTL